MQSKVYSRSSAPELASSLDPKYTNWVRVSSEDTTKYKRRRMLSLKETQDIGIELGCGLLRDMIKEQL